MTEYSHEDRSKRYIIAFSDPSAGIEAAGGKGASLARLAVAGFPVPEGFIVSTEGYRRSVAENGLQPAIDRAVAGSVGFGPDDFEAASQEIRRLIETAAIPGDLSDSIVRAYLDLPGRNPAVAVRSSATAEDLPEASFAGQQETRLNVIGSTAVLDAVRRCWASLWTARAIAYRSCRAMPSDAIALAVVVQLLVEADGSGIIFTADPVTGDRGRALISASWGLGEAVVGGAVTGDSIVVDKSDGRLLEYTIGDKAVMTLPGRAGTEERVVRDERRRQPVLEADEIGRLATLAFDIERTYRMPMDIEWARAGESFFVLQARPITALPQEPRAGEEPPATSVESPSEGREEWNDSLRGDYLWSNANFGEAVSSVMTPLTWSVLKFALEGWAFVPGHPTVGNIGGYPYINISVLASLFKAMGRDRKALLDELEPTLHLPMSESAEIPTISLSGWLLISSLAKSTLVRIRQSLGSRRLGRYLETNRPWFDRTSGLIRGQEDCAALRALFLREIGPHVQQGAWTVLGTVARSASYTQKLRKDLIALVGPEGAHRLITNSREGEGPLASMGPVVGLSRVSRGEMTRGHYVEECGHRGPDEFELSVPRPSEDPGWIDRQLAAFERDAVDVDGLVRESQEAFDEAWKAIVLRFPREAKAIGRRIAESTRRARLRELARSAYVRDRWCVRLFALRAGELCGLGNDIFFMELDEVLRLLSGERASITALAPLISERKKAYFRYKSLPPYPSVIRGSFDPAAWSADQCGGATPSPESEAITGSPGSAGHVEGTVRFLASPDDGERLQPGEILVTIQTDIAWTLLFPRAAGIITDVGAPLSHAAIVARELAIPAVVGCGDATRRLKTGDRVRMDGSRGIVEIIGKGIG